MSHPGSVLRTLTQVLCKQTLTLYCPGQGLTRWRPRCCSIPASQTNPSSRAPRPGRHRPPGAAWESLGDCGHQPAVGSHLPRRRALQLPPRGAAITAPRVCPPPEAGTGVGSPLRLALVAADAEDAGTPPRTRPCARYLALENPERQEWGPSLWSDRKPRVGPGGGWGQSCAPGGHSADAGAPQHWGLAVWAPASRGGNSPLWGAGQAAGEEASRPRGG